VGEGVVAGMVARDGARLGGVGPRMAEQRPPALGPIGLQELEVEAMEGGGRASAHAEGFMSKSS